MRNRWGRVAGMVVVGVAAFSSGCALGPRVIEQTHGEYACAIGRVEEEQLLRNIVRLRYLETPTNLEVAAVAAQYELSASAEARPFFSSEGVNGPFFRSFSSVLPYASFGASSRPTVSMTPQDDGSAVRRFLTPISIDSLVFLCQAGWPVGDVLRIWVDRMNGVPNFVPGEAPREAPPDFERFRRACALIRTAKDRELMSAHGEERTVEVGGPIPEASITAAAVLEAAKAGMEYRPKDGGKTWSLVKREQRLVLQVNSSGRNSPEVAELVGLLNLRADLARYDIVVAAGVPDPAKNPTAPAADLRVTTRSTAQALFFLANGVEVPPEHAASGLTPAAEVACPQEAVAEVFRVRTCDGPAHKRPANAYAAIRYRDRWYYIDDGDRQSKSTLLLMLELSRLDFKRQNLGAIPALTLPVGR